MSGLLHDESHRRHLILTVAVAVGLTLYLTGALRSVYGFDLALILALVGGFPIYLEALSGLLHRRLSADLAVSLAAAAALYIGQYAVAAEVILIMLIGEALEHFAVGRTRAGIASLLALRPHTARVRRDGQEVVVPASQVRREDIVVIRPGDRIPIDGRVTAGNSAVDQSPITGEGLPADKAPGDEVFAGTINLNGSLEVAVERLGADTTLERIIHLVERAEAAKAPTERLADRYATWFVPIVLLAAGLTYLFTRDVVRAVAVLVIACPCALVLATPTAVAAGIGGLVRRGILAKGGVVLERLGKLKTVIFDKTGTLTHARPRIAEIWSASGFSREEVVRLAAAVEANSEHPIGRLFVERARQQGLTAPVASGFKAHPGLGAEAVVEGQRVLVGNRRFLAQEGLALPADIQAALEEAARRGATVVLVARGSEVVGAVAVEDTIRADARSTVERLKGLGVRRVVMLTGDNAAAAQAVASEVGIEEVRSELLPDDKVQAVRELQEKVGPVAMVGDGVNDAPSLVTADVGVAMADIGTDVAVESANLVVVGHELDKIAEAVALGKKTLRIIWQNILGFALAFNLLAVLAASFGWVGPVLAAVVHQVSSLVVVVNSLRLLVDKRAWARRVASAREAVVARRRRLATGAAATTLAVYLLSGFHVVRLGEVGVVQRFGKVVRPIEQPGLHYRLPYPFGRLWRVRPFEVKRAEVGFRTMPGQAAGPAAYEWNVEHRSGRYVRVAEEATVWAGDENLVDVNLVVHYRVAEPLKALFGLGVKMADGSDKWAAVVRAAAEAALRAEMSARPTDDILADHRRDLEAAIARRIAATLARLDTGLVVLGVGLADVHPPLEVVGAFREVASALEKKEALINEAEAVRLETEALAEGKAAENVSEAEGQAADRVARAEGGAARFLAVAAAYARAPVVTRIRFYLQTIEQALAGKRKVIVEKAPAGARRMLFIGKKGVWPVAPAQAPLAQEGQQR